MNHIMTLPVFVALPLAGIAVDRLTQRLHRHWSAWRERQRRWANTVGDYPADDTGDLMFADLAKDTWAVQLAPPLARRRVRVPGTLLPLRSPGAALELDAAPARPAMPYVPRHGHDQLREPTAAYSVLDSPTAERAEFARITAAEWSTGETAMLRQVGDDHRCDWCRSGDHRDCPGCECPCTVDAYVDVAT